MQLCLNAILAYLKVALSAPECKEYKNPIRTYKSTSDRLNHHDYRYSSSSTNPTKANTIHRGSAHRLLLRWTKADIHYIVWAERPLRIEESQCFTRRIRMETRRPQRRGIHISLISVEQKVWSEQWDTSLWVGDQIWCCVRSRFMRCLLMIKRLERGPGEGTPWSCGLCPRWACVSRLLRNGASICWFT